MRGGEAGGGGSGGGSDGGGTMGGTGGGAGGGGVGALTMQLKPSKEIRLPPHETTKSVSVVSLSASSSSDTCSRSAYCPSATVLLITSCASSLLELCKNRPTDDTCCRFHA